MEGAVKKFNVLLKIPQIGWNTVVIKKDAPLFTDILQDSYFYFVHSYYCVPNSKKVCTGKTEYGTQFCSMLQDNNIFGVQFHPEKSGSNGLLLLKNFTKIIYENNTSN